MNDSPLEELDGDLSESIRNKLKGSQLGRRVGGSYGQEAGREIGQRVGAEIEDRFRSQLDSGSGLVGAVWVALKALPGAILQALRGGASPRGVVATLKSELKAELRSMLGDGEAVGETAEGAAETATETAQKGAETATETAGEATESATEAASAASETATETAESVSGLPENADKLRRETIRDLLEVMSYRDLQSTAKELDVPANQSYEDLIDGITEAFTDQSEADDESAEAESES